MTRQANRGVLIITDPNDSGERQVDTFTCHHCMSVRPLPEMGAICKKCMRAICKRPVCHQKCTPITQALY